MPPLRVSVAASFFCVRRQYLLQMPPFDLDLLAITMKCSASLFFSGITEKCLRCVIVLFRRIIFPFSFLSKEQRYKTSYFSHSAFCLVSCFSLSWYVKHSQWIIYPHLVSLLSRAQSYIHFSFGQTINIFQVSAVNSNYRGLCPFTHTIKYYTFTCIGLTDAHVLGASPVRRIKYRKLETTTFNPYQFIALL